MNELITVEIEDVELYLHTNEDRTDIPDLWSPVNVLWDGPKGPAPLNKWKELIKEWRSAKQIDAGFEIWDIQHKSPKHWHKRPAVFREGKEGEVQWWAPLKVLTRNNMFDPDNLYKMAIGDCAMDTPEVAEAIERVHKLHKLAVEANRQLDAAIKAIPRMTKDDWRKLPAKPGEEND